MTTRIKTTCQAFLHALLWVAAVSTSHAVEYSGMLIDKSTLGFTFRQMGVPVDGRFKKFSGELNFDPQKVEQSKVNLVIELTSIDTGSREADAEAIGKAWFNTKTFPTATFNASRIRSLGSQRFEVTGTLSLKGKSREITAPVSFKTEGSTGLFEGSFVLKRVDYGIGEGPWADFDTVGNDIQIKFRITTPIRVIPSHK